MKTSKEDKRAAVNSGGSAIAIERGTKESGRAISKKFVVVATVVIFSGVATAVAFGALKRFAGGHSAPLPVNKGAVNAACEIVEEISLPKVKLSGISKTATGIGEGLSLSAQKVNKIFVAKGLIVKSSCGGYDLTDLGKLFGKEVVKTTWSGYTFSNIEWDTSVISFLFSEEELAGFAARKETLLD